jgi:hypothetical protein
MVKEGIDDLVKDWKVETHLERDLGERVFNS